MLRSITVDLCPPGPQPFWYAVDIPRLKLLRAQLFSTYKIGNYFALFKGRAVKTA